MREFLLEYIDTASEGFVVETGEEELPKEKRQVVYPDEGKGFSPYWFTLMILFGIFTGIFFGYSKRTVALIFLVLTLATAYWTFGGRYHHQHVGSQQGYQPQQPIEYSHELHAGQLEIACLYCHHGAEKSAVAGIPSINVCMNCP